MIHFKCLQCGAEIEAPTSLHGQVLACPECSRYNLVPSSEDTVILDGDSLQIPPQTTRTEHRLGRVARMQRACQITLKESKTITRLLEEICRIVVDIGGYRLAWVGLAEYDQHKTVRPVAQRGYEEDYLATVKITWADTERGRGPTGTAIRTAKPVINQNVLENPDYAPWREEARRRGYASSIALPLIAEVQVLGALNIYAAQPAAFDTMETELLRQVADDLARGVMALLRKRKR
ncbi:MAG: GAF domain-containing protein [Sedimentisphaerales bacterium]|nr:GAF domain-containing protein [Sedimentisphaerales bacterium]